MSRFKPRLLLVPTAIAVTLGFAGIAFANPSSASATCQGGIVYEGHQYPPSGNTVTVYIDGHVAAGFPKTYGTQTSGTVANPDKTVGHTWSVVWDRYQGTDGDRTQSGEISACEVAPTTTAAPTTTLAPTTTVGTSSTAVATLDTPPPPALVAVDVPPAPQPQGVSAAEGGGQTLPATGAGDELLTWGASVVLLIGLCMVVAARRRRRDVLLLEVRPQRRGSPAALIPVERTALARTGSRLDR